MANFHEGVYILCWWSTHDREIDEKLGNIFLVVSFSLPWTSRCCIPAVYATWGLCSPRSPLSISTNNSETLMLKIQSLALLFKEIPTNFFVYRNCNRGQIAGARFAQSERPSLARWSISASVTEVYGDSRIGMLLSPWVSADASKVASVWVKQPNCPIFCFWVLQNCWLYTTKGGQELWIYFSSLPIYYNKILYEALYM